MTARTRPLAALCLLAVLVVGCLTRPGGGPVATETATETETATVRASGAGAFGRIPELVRQVEPSVVAILVETSQGQGQGSGVIWGADGTIVTNNHVVADADRVEVAFADGSRVPADVVATDPFTDLAVLGAERDGLPAADFASELPEVGELAVAIGNPLGLENTVTAGIISGLNRSVPGALTQGATALVDLLQTDAPISPGNSGGALVDGRGRIVGINVAYVPPQQSAVSIGFAIPAPTVTDVVRQLLATGDVEHAYLGIQGATLTPEIADRFDLDADSGVVVLAVEDGSPAAAAGLRPGDLLVAFGDRPLPQIEDLFGALRTRRPGERVTLSLVRDGARQQARVTLSDRPDG
ncbi:MAG: trypsin-like peptidase domain-containing protein [Actinomycetota bacterium]|nr:trypsin-like peptidase domain-containing protein [Actinomycetota bacterium]